MTLNYNHQENIQQQLDRESIEHAPIGIFTATPDGKYLSANPALARIHGYDSPQQLMSNITDIASQVYHDPQEREEFKHLLETRGEVINYESQFLRKDGSSFWVSRNVRAVRDHNGNIVYYQGFVTDITQRKEAEQELNRKNEQLSKLLAEKDRFFSIIAHDLKAPLNGLLGFATLLSENLAEFTPEELQEAATNMKQSAENLHLLLENLLEWARMQKGETSYEPRSLDLADETEQVINLFTPVAENKDLEITSGIPSGSRVWADQRMLGTVIRNLVSNAVKFTSPGGQIHITAESLENTCRIQVQDTGEGMDEETLADLFTLESKNSREGTQGETGTGLGLLLCQEFVRKHTGRIWATSTPAQGSTFFFTLPRG